MRRSFRELFLLCFFSLVLPLSAAEAQHRELRFGAMFGAGVSGAPLGSVAEHHGLYAVPGTDYEARVLFSSGRHEWSIGGIWDRYRVTQTTQVSSYSRFDYTSSAVVVGYSTVVPTAGVPISYGIDLGVSEFRARSSTPSEYTGEREDSHARGRAALLNLSYGVEIPLARVALVPRLRLSTSYPDFGGGDGRSALHRESDLGFKASFGVGVKKLTSLSRK